MPWKVVCAEAEAISIWRRCLESRLRLVDDTLEIEGAVAASIPLYEIEEVEVVWGLIGRTIRIRHRGRVLALAVARLNLMGYLVATDAFLTGQLAAQLATRAGGV